MSVTCGDFGASTTSGGAGLRRTDVVERLVPPGGAVGALDQAYVPPAIQCAGLRRRPLTERSAA